jgi:hypothetical protein
MCRVVDHDHVRDERFPDQKQRQRLQNDWVRCDWCYENAKSSQRSVSKRHGAEGESARCASEVQLFGYAISRSSVRSLRRGRKAGRTGATMVVHHDETEGIGS